MSYEVDIVFCIDVTGSMEHKPSDKDNKDRFIDIVRNNVSRFPDDLEKSMERVQKTIDSLRIKVIAFRDYYCDGDRAMEISKFYDIKNDRVQNDGEKEAFVNFIRSLKADGGGDEPECGLEALAYAIKSDWTRREVGKRHIIAIFTDASAHSLEEDTKHPRPPKPSNYPTDLPKDIHEIADLWRGQTMNKAAKRLLLFAPDAYPWTQISQEWRWENVIHYPASAGAGLSDTEYDVILDTISNSIKGGG